MERRQQVGVPSVEGAVPVSADSSLKSPHRRQSEPSHSISPNVSMLLGKYEFVWTPKRRILGI
jgi:hypothetical protein